jgi:hypothetical protein
MTADLTDRIIAQGRALVRAIEALGTIQLSGPPADGRLQTPPAWYREGYVCMGDGGGVE